VPNKRERPVSAVDPDSPRACGSASQSSCECVLPLFYELARTIAAGKDIPGVMDAAVKVIVENLAGAERVVLSILNRKTGAAFIENAWGLSDEERARGVYRMGEGITGYVVQTGDSLVVPNIAEEPAFLDRTGARRDVDTSCLAFICVPVKLGREVMGTLSVDLSNSSSCLEDDRELLTVVAAMIAQAVQLYRARQEENAELREENRRLLEELADRRGPDNIVGNSHPMQALYRYMKKVMDKTTPVLILGESGTGKELVAAALHYGSPRKDKPFVRFNCAAIPENLAESEMFGFEKGAFTGALYQRIGRFEEADGGTLFMDEIGELSLSIQAKLLRVLQSRQFERVGGNKTLTVDIRIVAATNRDLAALVKSGAFREDLYYRLNVFPLQLPPLRERGSDILLLADHFVEKHAGLHKSPVRRISTPAIDALMAYHWPGNVRELENIIERAVILSDDGVIHSYHLPPTLQTAESSGTRYRGTLVERLDTVERELIVDAVKASAGNMAQAARELGLSERVMALRVQKHGIDYRLFRPKTSQ
jgi:Nif-specific regulatory protein